MKCSEFSEFSEFHEIISLAWPGLAWPNLLFFPKKDCQDLDCHFSKSYK
jgi:hypothetical protein